MADEADEIVLPKESHTEILARQEQERREFKKKVERIRSSIPKKDRAGRARAAEDAEEEEKRLLQAQAEERLEAGIEDVTPPPTSADAEVTSTPQTAPPATKSESKAARRRRKKAEQEAEAQRRIDEEKAAMGPSPKLLELKEIEKQLKPNNFRIHPIAADGHCLYSAVAHQMQVTNFVSTVSASVEGLRSATADYMLANKKDYLPFIESANGEDDLFQQYCEELRNEAVWGGQVELKAMSELLNTEIEVYAADLPVVKMGQSTSSPTFRVSFHRQYFGLGEHYNSVVPYT